MLTVYTSTFCRPDYVSLLACALQKTLAEPYRFVVVVHPGGLRRPWEGVDEVVAGTTSGYNAWKELLPMMQGPSVILHDDCIPVLPWSLSSFCAENCSRFAGHTLQYHKAGYRRPVPCLLPERISSATSCPAGWPESLCVAAVNAKVESLLNGAFLHVDKGTIVHPMAVANEAKPALVNAIAEHLGCEVPAALTADELRVHPGMDMPRTRGLGDIVASGLAAVGITKQRVSQALGKPCNCGQRQEALNDLGRRLGIG